MLKCFTQANKFILEEDKDPEELKAEQQNSLNIFKNKPFYFEVGLEEFNHNKIDCCFNHIVGLPRKDNNVEYPLFEYEELIFDHLKNHKYLWIKKATGLGITEFFLRYMAWLCLKDNKYQHSQMCIVTGPNHPMAVKLIKRIKNMFEYKLGIVFQDKETVLELNNCRIEAYPSNHIDSFRSLDSPKFILLDEGDFFRKSEQDEVRHVAERYIAKSNPFIVMISTPNAPGGLFERIENEPDETCLYKKIKLDYTYGLNNIFTEEDIEIAKTSPSFEREYNLKYLGVIGNVFHENDIQKALEMGLSYDPLNLSLKDYVSSSMGIDVGFGSSAFGIVITRYDNEKERVQVLYADEFERPDYNEMLLKIGDLVFDYNPTKIYVDGANPAFIKSLKIQLGDKGIEQKQFDRIEEMAKKFKRPIDEYMRVIPVMFNKEHRSMLANCKLMLEKGYIEINPKFDRLVTALRTAVEKGEGSLDKESTSYDDVFDSFRLALKYYKIESYK